MLNPFAGYQSRYVAYCRTHGASSPDEMWERDRESMVEYMEWIGQKWGDWRDEAKYYGPLTDAAHEEFDRWLAASLSGPQLSLFRPTPTPETR